MVFRSNDPTGWTVAAVLVLAFLALASFALVHYVRQGGSTTLNAHDATTHGATPTGQPLPPLPSPEPVHSQSPH